MPRNDDEDDLGSVELPRMGSSEVEALAWVQACVDRLAAGEIGTKKFAALMTASSKQATLLKNHRENTDVPRMEAMLEEMRELDAKAEGRANAVQQGRRASH